MSNRRARRAPAGIAAVLVLAALAVQLLGAGPAAAHARLEALDLPPSPDVTALQERIGLRVTNKEATVEGDPIQVFSAQGARIDNADPVVDRGGDRISVSIRPGTYAPGRYTVVYHVVSADSHVVRGREALELRPATGYAAWQSVTVEAPAAAPARAPLHRAGGIAWPALLLATAGVGTVGYRRRARVLAAVPNLVRRPATPLALDQLPPPPPPPPVVDGVLHAPVGPASANLSSSERVPAAR